MKYDRFKGHFSDENFFQKVKKFGAKLSRTGLWTGFTLFYCLKDEETPTWVRTIILGALGYFIFPLDAIPDFIPVLGFTDDLGALAGAFSAVVPYVKPEHKERASAKVADLLREPRSSESDEGDVVYVDV